MVSGLLAEESLMSARCLDTTAGENVRRSNVGTFKRATIFQGVRQYIAYRNENENPGNAKHLLGLFSEESLMSAR